MKLRIDTWIWALIYGGMFLIALGIALAGSDATLGWGIGITGAALLLAGIVLVWVRSRMKEPV